MEEEIEMLLEEAKEAMEKAIRHTESEFAKLRAGKAHPDMIKGVIVEYYGALSPIHQIASISTPDARSIAIKPWEKNLVSEIEKAINTSKLGISPFIDGKLVRLIIPSLSKERREELVKVVRDMAEHGRISLRTIRRDTNERIKKVQS